MQGKDAFSNPESRLACVVSSPVTAGRISLPDPNLRDSLRLLSGETVIGQNPVTQRNRVMQADFQQRPFGIF